MKKLRVLVIRHEACSTVGLLAPQLKTVEVHYLDAPAGCELVEPISNYSHIVILGGAISAYEYDRYAFLRQEFKLLEDAIAQRIPIVGICLGSQILAQILGAKVDRGQAGREVGWCDVELLEAAKTDLLLQDFPSRFKVFQSHQDTFEIPPNCVHLASSTKYPNQAFCYQNHVWAIQFHLEMDDRALASCAPVIETELRDSQIRDTTLPQLLAEAKQNSEAIAPLTDRFMQQFLQLNSAVYLNT
ncbi:type 1 glutamine amidotransferase [Microcoleus sp. FACHB-1515]|uniref:type 1 glutamine amidotransferase n=1 Tax=Cyanophyceae TaxID=3028117 RepID=UPI00168A137C|nr:type 1 glutamine amidotransferase [Microcoleus sp. FACHB-1515]MBD2092582.1 type 1 glutamine amidotransferase [Microcoleus sp. FACHB-1515]